MTPQQELELRRAAANAQNPQEELTALRALATAQKATEPTPGAKLRDFLASAAASGKTLGKNLLRGAADTAAFFAEGPAKNMADVVGDDSAAMGRAVQQALPVPPDETPTERLLRLGAEGVGGAVAAGPLSFARAPATMAGAGAVSTIVGDTAGRAVQEAVPDSPRLAAAAQLLAGMAAGPVTVYGASRFNSLGQRQPMRDVRQAVSPQDLPELTANWELLQRQGMRSATLADAAPEGSGLRALADTVRQHPGGEALRDRIALRPMDIAALQQRVGGTPVSPAAVAERAADVANQVLGRSRVAEPNASQAGGLRQFRNIQYSRQFDMPGSDTPIPGRLSTLRDRLRADLTEPARGQNLDFRDAYAQLEQAVLSPDPLVVPQPPQVQVSYPRRAEPGRPPFRVREETVTPQPSIRLDVENPSIQAAAARVKQMQAQANSGQFNSLDGGRNIEAGVARRGLGIADDVLREASPQYAAAQDQFRSITQGLVNPTLQGPVGILAGRNTRPEMIPVPLGRLNTAFAGQSPETIERTLQGLGRVGLGRGPAGEPRAPNADLPGQIADALVQQKLAANPQDLGAALRGQPGSAQEASLLALQRGAGRDPASMQEALQASDLLQGLAKPPGISTQMHLPWYSWPLRPFRSLDMSGISRQDALRRQAIAEMLTSPGGLRQLQEAVMFDPNLRRELAAVSAILPATQETE